MVVCWCFSIQCTHLAQADAAARKEAAQEWIEAWRLRSRVEASGVEPALGKEDSVEDRRAAVQAWISAWRARTSVVVREVVNA